MTEDKIRENYQGLRDIYGPLGLTVAGDVSFLVWLDEEEKSLSEAHEDRCNYSTTIAEDAQHEERCLETIESIEAAMPELVGLVWINGDPRGASIKIDPYVDRDGHDSRHGCHQWPPARDLIRGCGITSDWGGYGMLAPQYQVS